MVPSQEVKCSATSSASERGFSLVELMVAVAIGLFLVVAVLFLQARMAAQNMRTADTGVRDNEARAAMDAISRDVSGAGFLHGGSNGNCFAMLNYNSALSGGYFAGFPASSLAGGNGVTLPFVVAPGITLNYPVSGSTNRSDVLVIRGTSDASQLASSVTPMVPAMDNPSFAPMTTGQIPFGINPPLPLAAGQTALVQVPVGTLPSTQLICIRVPVTSVVPNLNGSAYITSSGAMMPAAGYGGFSTQFAGIGLTGALSDVLLRNAKVIGLGAPAVTNQLTYAYFVDNSYRWPTLVRATINALTDQEVANSRQEIAAGVVSFQVLFGVGTPATGVTGYQTWAQVLAAGNVPKVLTVRMLILQRSLYPDKDFTNSVSAIPLSTQFAQAAYSDYTIPDREISHRFVAQEAELAVRNGGLLWPK